MVGLLSQGDLEVLDRIGQSMALVLLLTAQEVIERGLGANVLGLGELSSLAGPIVSCAPGRDAFLRWYARE